MADDHAAAHRLVSGWLDDPRTDRGVRFLGDDGQWQRLSYAELADLSLRAGAALADSGVRRGDVVPLALPNGIDLVVENTVANLELILERGGMPGLPAVSNGNRWDLIGKIIAYGRKDLFAGPVWQAIHNYSRNRPLDYPYDIGNQEGAAYTYRFYQVVADESWGENAWRGVSAPGYLFIHCFWILGRNKGKGYGTKLLNACLRDARASGYFGVAVLTSYEHWLPNKRIFERMGFEQVDSAPPAFELYAKRFSREAQPAHIQSGWKKADGLPKGLTLLESDQCPYIHVTAESLGGIGQELGVPVQVIRIETAKQAQQSVCPYGVTGVYFNGKLVSYHPIGPKDLLAAVKSLQAKA